MRDLKAGLDELVLPAGVLAGAFGSLSAGLAVGCERDAGVGPGSSSDIVVSTAPLRATPSAGPALAPSAALSDPVLANGSSPGTGATSDDGASTPASGERSSTCVAGWSAPPRGSSLRKAALDMMQTAPDERFLVDEIRYFVGPEDADVVDRGREVERWYVKARTESQPERRQRWLVRRAAAGSGVDAVAPYDSRGFGPGVWVRTDAVDPRFADPFQRPCDLAGRERSCMGLPREVLGCLSSI